jgi:hypothetical protein
MADIKQNIQDFYRVAQERDFLRSFQFRILDVSNQGAPVLTQDDLVYATTASLPARAINMFDVPFMGLNFHIPGTATYPGSEGYDLNFRCDSDATLRRLFEDWSTSIFNDETSSGDYKVHANSTVTLALLDQDMNATQLYTLYGVIPTTVGALEFDVTAGADAVNFTATIAYQYWRRRGV